MRNRVPAPGDAWTPDDARRILDEWRATDESLAAFARLRGVSPQRLYWWRRRLAGGAAGVAAPTLSLIPAAITMEAATVSIRLPGGIVIESTTASASWVAALVAELTRSLP